MVKFVSKFLFENHGMYMKMKTVWANLPERCHYVYIIMNEFMIIMADTLSNQYNQQNHT